jgi:hypothetical protein
MKRMILWISLVMLATIFGINLRAQNSMDAMKPRQVVLTWQNDPSTTMTITWRTDSQEGSNVLRYAESPDAKPGKWKYAQATTFSFEETSGWIHTTELTGLKPDRKYYVVINHPDSPDKFHFRTIPDKRGIRDLVILAGGDSRSRRDVRREMNELAARQNPDYVIFDGDFIATALNEQQWDEWFDDWHEQMITADGRRIPVVPAIGNHEIDGGYNQTRDKAPFYFNRFIVPDPRNYYTLNFGQDLVLITLDTDHATGVSEQTGWLDRQLEVNRDVRWKLVQYHVAAWPSVRDFDGEIPVKIRNEWIPVLEKHNVDLVIEAHDHAYKKSVPIRNNRQDDVNGIIYLGDGGWGAPTRETKNPDEYWWLAEAVSIDHFWKITLTRDARNLLVEPVFRPAGKGFTLSK